MPWWRYSGVLSSNRPDACHHVADGLDEFIFVGIPGNWVPCGMSVMSITFGFQSDFRFIEQWTGRCFRPSAMILQILFGHDRFLTPLPKNSQSRVPIVSKTNCWTLFNKKKAIAFW
jgi:hypothetical protein